MAHVLAQDLRNAVLQAAFEGKLSEAIKTDSEIIIDSTLFGEEPYDLPSSWKWCCLKDVVWTRKQKKPDKTFSYIDIGSIDNEHQKLNNKETIIEAKKAPSRARKTVEIGDIIYSTVRPYLHNMAIIDRTFSHEPIASTGFAAMVCNNGINNHYLFNYLKSPYFDKYANDTDNSKGVAYPAINDKKLYAAPVPICSPEEQARIVARVDELMAKIDEYEKIEKQLVELQKNFPGNMKDAILQAAFSGLLTERMPEDSSVDQYLKECQYKRLEYEKTYKEKKHKALWESDDIETQFDIPDEWRWAFVGDVFRHNAGKALNAKNTTGTKRKYLTTSNVYTDHFDLENLREMYYTDDEAEKCSVRKGDLLVLEGGDCGRTALWDLEETYCIQNHLHRLRLFGDGNIKYFFYLLSFYKEVGYTKGKGIAIQGLSANALHNIVIPIPPIEEQQRIVDKLDRLLPLCDQLEKLA